MVGRPPAVLSTSGLAAEDGLRPLRAVALAALLACLVVWSATAGELPGASDRFDVALTALVLIPATFGAIWLALPVATARGTGLVALALGGLAVALTLAGWSSGFDAAKLAALTLAGFWFLSLFETSAQVALVALLIPWVDAFSVYRGPTKVVVEQKPGLFDRISVGFRLPGEEGGARIGPPDILFFALFLAAAHRFRLRTAWTWVGMVAGLGATLVATYAYDLGGMPALPGIAIGFLAPNADLLWRAARDARRSGRDSA
jgi:hypothetical protein